MAYLVFKATDTTDAGKFGGAGRCGIFVFDPDDNEATAFPTGVDEVNLQIYVEGVTDVTDGWYNTGISWTEPSVKGIWMLDDEDYRLHSSTAGVVGLFYEVNEKVEVV